MVLARRAQRSVDRDLEGCKGLGEAGLIVRGADEPGLSRVGLAQDAFIVQHPGSGVVEGVIAALPIAVIARWIVRKVQAAHGGVTHEAVSNAASLENGAHA